MTTDIPWNSSFPSDLNDIHAEITATIPQIAILNNLLPRGFRFELYESVQKLDPSFIKTGKRKQVVINL